MERERHRDLVDDLTPRECQVLDCLARGYRTDDLAVEFGLARKSMQNVVDIICQKLGALTRAHAVALYLNREYCHETVRNLDHHPRAVLVR